MKVSDERPLPLLSPTTMAPRFHAAAQRVLFALRIGLLPLALAACGSDADAEGGEASVSSAEIPADSAVAAPVEPVGPATDLPPNELGRVMVLEYHRLGSPEGEFYRTAENFRADLERLYQAGYRPITLRQLAEGNIDVPRGTTPVVFTIDDSSTGQFYLLEDGTIDPNSMVGMWEAFARENPGWSGGATWCVLPAADHPSNFFGERPSREVERAERERRIQWKIDYLLENGHEICNHTLYHARLDRAESDAQVQEWIGRGADSIRVYLPPEYEIKTLALPLGMWPRNRALASRGTYNGSEYHHPNVLEVSGGPNVSPFDQEWDPLSIDRVIVAPNHLERLLAGYDSDPSNRFVSDGEVNVISVPESAVSAVARDRFPELEVRAVPVPVAPTSSAPSGTPATPDAAPRGEGS